MSIQNLFHFHQFQLKNGLRVLVVPNDLAPVVAVGVVYCYGSSDDDPSVMGIAHFLEHMMFKGTLKVPAGQFDRKILQCGGQTNAWTHYDQTVYHTEVPVDSLEMMLELEADRMHNLAFTKEQVQSERDVVMQERLMRLENHPFGQVYEASLKSCFWYHPYGVPVIGYPHHIQAYNYDNTRAAYQKWYAPNNAILIISGKVNPKMIQPVVDKYFGSIPSKEIPKRTRPAEPNHQGITQTIEQKNKRNSLILTEWVYAAPNHLSEGKEHYYALQVLAEMIAGKKTRELYRHLVEDKKLALSLECQYAGHFLDPYGFTIQATVAPNASLKEVKKIVQDFIEKLLKDGSKQDQIDKAKRDLIAQAVFAKDGIMNPIEVFSDLAHGHSIDEINAWPEKIHDVTKEQVDAAIQFVFLNKPIMIMDLFPEKPTASA